MRARWFMAIIDQRILDMLVSATVKPNAVENGPRTEPKEKKHCPRKNMGKYCPRLNLGGKIIGVHDKRSWRTRTNANCKSNNCIHAIECTHFGQHYVGQISRHVGRRMYEHYTSIQQENKIVQWENISPRETNMRVGRTF